MVIFPFGLPATAGLIDGALPLGFLLADIGSVWIPDEGGEPASSHHAAPPQAPRLRRGSSAYNGRDGKLGSIASGSYSKIMRGQIYG